MFLAAFSVFYLETKFRKHQPFRSQTQHKLLTLFVPMTLDCSPLTGIKPAVQFVTEHIPGFHSWSLDVFVIVYRLLISSNQTRPPAIAMMYSIGNSRESPLQEFSLCQPNRCNQVGKATYIQENT